MPKCAPPTLVWTKETMDSNQDSDKGQLFFLDGEKTIGRDRCATSDDVFKLLEASYHNNPKKAWAGVKREALNALEAEKAQQKKQDFKSKVDQCRGDEVKVAGRRQDIMDGAEDIVDGTACGRRCR